MDNPHPTWECYMCHRQWQWTAQPTSCGFCHCTWVLPVSENAKALVAFEREVETLARPRARRPRSRPIIAGSVARLGW